MAFLPDVCPNLLKDSSMTEPTGPQTPVPWIAAAVMLLALVLLVVTYDHPALATPLSVAMMGVGTVVAALTIVYRR